MDNDYEICNYEKYKNKILDELYKAQYYISEFEKYRDKEGDFFNNDTKINIEKEIGRATEHQNITADELLSMSFEIYSEINNTQVFVSDNLRLKEFDEHELENFITTKFLITYLDSIHIKISEPNYASDHSGLKGFEILRNSINNLIIDSRVCYVEENRFDKDFQLITELDNELINKFNDFDNIEIEHDD